MARQTKAVAMQAAATEDEFGDIVARSMPTAINADMVLTGMARKALDAAVNSVHSSSFDDVLLHVFKEGIRLGRADAPKRAGRPRGSKNLASDAEQQPKSDLGAQEERAVSSALGFARN